MLVYGPVPSRRLGRSLGLNNIPYKYCSYSCIYCQVGRTTKMQVEPADFYAPKALLRETKARIQKVGADGQAVDYITFVPDGEPTLDRNLHELIAMIKQELSFPVAVITNGSLLWRPEVARAVALADWVSVKVDTVVEPVWRRINRPDPRLEQAQLLEGMRSFAAGYRGELVTETMLVGNVNTDPEDLAELAKYLRELSPKTAYLSVPSQPPAEAEAVIPGSDEFDRAWRAFEESGLKVKSLVGYGGDQFTVTGDTARNIQAMAAVHPLREDALRNIVERAGSDWQLIEQLLVEGRLQKTEHDQETYYRTVSRTQS
jgi:wyosine [tRNA(Phe)-imidazoG37] synthetase (radical SAM superfamily)